MTAPPWGDDPQLPRLIAALTETGGEARLVGGAVRDWLSGRAVHDIDIATTLPPAESAAALEKAGFRIVPTGLAHGSITAVAKGRSFEVTTLRRDLETDGRRAQVGFDAGWPEDAGRRDFTVNAVYADLGGKVHDPLGVGRADIEARRLRFVGAPDERIREDYLRILRFYRLAAETGFSMDPEGRSACARRLDGLPGLSAERLWNEMRRIFAAEGHADAIRHMQEDGVLAAILPEAGIAAWRHTLPAGEPLLVLATLLGGPDPVPAVTARWKMSGAERRRLAAAVVPLAPGIQDNPAELRALAWRDGKEAVLDRLRIATARGVPGAPDISGADRAIRRLQDWTPPTLPVGGEDALTLGVKPGAAVGQALRTLEDWWIENDFSPDREACLARLQQIIGRDAAT